MNLQIRDSIGAVTGMIKRITPLRGGDISLAFRLETETQAFFVKVNRETDALKMFETESRGLETIRNTSTICAPRPIMVGQSAGHAFLVLEFIESRQPTPKDFEKLGNRLCALHRSPVTLYGADEDNFIGSLPQKNVRTDNWPGFYGDFRLIPQLTLARERGYLEPGEIPDPENIHRSLSKILNCQRPSALHGDLWNGNFLISPDGEPFLIDPAFYCGHSQVDIAMTKLFGGFGPAFYAAYYSGMDDLSLDPPELDLYQLYYLLVHLNLFGSSYYPAVMKILSRYFS